MGRPAPAISCGSAIGVRARGVPQLLLQTTTIQPQRRGIRTMVRAVRAITELVVGDRLVWPVLPRTAAATLPSSKATTRSRPM